MKSYWKLKKIHLKEYFYSKEKINQKIENKKRIEKEEKARNEEQEIKNKESKAIRIEKQEIDLMNVFLCLLVVFIHVVSEAVSCLRIESWQFLIIYIPQKLASFVVYGFIFLNGIKLFLKGAAKIDFVNYFKGRIRKIILPYLIGVVIYYLYFIYKGYFTFSITALFHHIITGDLVGHFYFMIIIIQFYLLFPLFRKLVKEIHPAVGITIAFLITFLFTRYLPAWIPGFQYNDRLFTTYLFYWIVGAYVGSYYEKVGNMLSKRNIRIALCLLFIGIAVFYIIINYGYLRFHQFLNWLDIIQICYHVIAIFFLMTICIFLVSKKNFFENRMLRHEKSYHNIFLKNGEFYEMPLLMKNLYKVIMAMNQVSYFIYLYHVLVIFLVNEILEDFKITNMGERLLIRFVLVYSVLILYSILKLKAKRVKKRYRLSS